MIEMIEFDASFFFRLVLLIISCSAILYELYKKRRMKMNILRDHGIPGPQPHLITGNMNDYFNVPNVMWDNELTEKYGQIAGYYVGAKPFVLVSDPDLVELIQGGRSTEFLDRPRRVPGGINPDPKRALMLGNLNVPDWQRMRKTLSPLFTPAKLRAMIPAIAERIDIMLSNLASNIQEEPSIDIYPYFQGLTLDIIGTTAFGLDCNVQADPANSPLLQAAIAEFAKTTNALIIKIYLCLPEISWIFQYIRRFAEKIKSFLKPKKQKESENALWNLGGIALKLRRREIVQNMPTRADLLDLLLNSANNLTDDQIVANSVLFFEVSYETLSGSLGFIIHLLVNHQEAQDRVREELNDFYRTHKTFDTHLIDGLKFLDAVIKEGLRLLPPQTTFIGRSPANDFIYTNKDGKIFKFPKGIHILIGLTQLHYNEELWQNPTTFDPDRFMMKDPNQHKMSWQAFGAGPRVCIGLRFANFVLKLTLAKLFHKFMLLPTEKTEKIVSIQYKIATMTPKNGSWALLKAVDDDEAPKGGDVHGSD